MEIAALLKQVGADSEATEAVAYDPFADDDEDDAAAQGTAAVAFDPFADDDDEDEDSGAASTYTDPDNIAALIKDLGVLRDKREKHRNGGGKNSALMDTSQRSRQQALDTFRELRLAARTNREVADGMVSLPLRRAQ